MSNRGRFPVEIVKTTGVCRACGKYGYVSRRTARKAAKVKHPEDRLLRAYECVRGSGYWHIGHQLRGRDWYRRRRAS